MSFGDHLDALRRAVFFSLIPPVVLIFAIWPFWDKIHHVVSHALLNQQGLDKLTRLTAMDTFSLSIKISVYLALLITVPWIVMQLWFFIRPGLRPHERRFGYIAIPLSIVLFLGGASFGMLVVLPTVLEFLLNFGSDAVAHDFLGIEYFYAIVFSMVLILGLTFQLPLIVSSAIRFRIIKREFIIKHRRIVLFAAAVLGAILTPTGDPVSMSMVALPIYLLIEGGVILGTHWKKRSDKQAALAPQSISEGFAEGLGEGDKQLPAASRDAKDNSGAQPDKSDSLADRLVDSIGGLAKSIGRNVEEGMQAIRDQRDAVLEDDATEGAGVARGQAEEASGQTEELDSRLRGNDTSEWKRAPQSASETEKPASDSELGKSSAGGRADLESDRADSGSASTSDSLSGEHKKGSHAPPLPRELRRRIDAYIRDRLEQLLDEVSDDPDLSDDTKDETKDSNKKDQSDD